MAVVRELRSRISPRPVNASHRTHLVRYHDRIDPALALRPSDGLPPRPPHALFDLSHKLSDLLQVPKRTLSRMPLPTQEPRDVRLRTGEPGIDEDGEEGAGGGRGEGEEEEPGGVGVEMG